MQRRVLYRYGRPIYRAFLERFHVIARVCVTNSNFQFLIDSRRRAGISERDGERERERDAGVSSTSRVYNEHKSLQEAKKTQELISYFSTLAARRKSLFFYASQTVLCSRKPKASVKVVDVKSNAPGRWRQSRRAVDSPAIERTACEDLRVEDQPWSHPEDERANNALAIFALLGARRAATAMHRSARCISPMSRVRFRRQSAKVGLIYRRGRSRRCSSIFRQHAEHTGLFLPLLRTRFFLFFKRDLF